MNGPSMKLLSFCIASIGLYAAAHAGAPAAARYEAEDARLAGGAALKGPSLVQSDVAAQASDMKYVELGKRGAKLEWKLREGGVDGVTLRFTMPDREDGWKQGNPQDETPQYRREEVVCGSLELRVNGKKRKVRQYGKVSEAIPLSSYWMWQYFVGDRPADEPGGHEIARFAFDEVHFAIDGAPLAKGDVLSLANVDGKYPYGVDFLELEKIPAPIPQPEGSLSVADFGTGREAIDKCFAACREQGKTMYFPSGVWEYWTKTGDNRWLLNGASNMKITGAGMWHTNLHFPGSKPFGGGVGGDRLAKGTEFCHMYLSSMLRSRFNQNAVYKGIMEAWGEGAKLHHLWIEHFECGFWLGDYQSPAKPTVKAHIHDCRVRNNLADGINFCQGTSDTLLEDCSFRGNGDDGIAIWNNDACGAQDCTGITIRNNTVENNWRAASIAVFGGDGHLIENNFIKDGFKGAGIRLNTDFPGHQFRNTKLIRFVGNTIVNCGTSWDCYGDQAQDRPSPRGAIDFQGEVRNIVFERTAIVGAHRAAVQMIVGNMENISFKDLVVDTIGTDGGRKSRYTWAEDLGPGRVFHLLGEMKPVVDGITIRNVSKDNLVNLQEKDKKCIVWVKEPVFSSSDSTSACDGGWDRRFKYDWRIDLKDGAAASHSIENGGDGRVKVVVTRPRAAYSPRKGSARTVVIRKGVTKLSRPLVLASDEELFLEEGAVLTADAESKDFPVCGRKDSLERPLTWLITTEPGATNVAIRGSGVIDANGTEMFRRGMLVSAVVPHACDGFVMEGVTVVDGNFWTVTPVRSRNVRLRDVAVLNDVDDLRENDAFDVCESSDVVVENCLGVSRDDSFSTKTWSGHRGQVAAKWHGGPLPLERVLFKGCTAWTRCAAFKVGDGVSQPQRDVVFRDSRAFGCRHAVRYSHANGLAETKGVVFENIRIDSWDNRKWPFGWLDIAPAEAGVPGELTLRNIIVRE